MNESKSDDWWRNHEGKLVRDRNVDQMLGIMGGVLADGIVSQAEAEHLRRWIHANGMASNKLVAHLFELLEDTLSDGVLDDEEAAQLRSALIAWTGIMSPDGEMAKTTELPLDPAPRNVEISGRVFVFTGTSAFGTRRKLEEATTSAGGIFGKNLTKKTDYLVLGEYVTPSWKHETYGRKIERGMELRDVVGTGLCIVAERDWYDAMLTVDPQGIDEVTMSDSAIQSARDKVDDIKIPRKPRPKHVEAEPPTSDVIGEAGAPRRNRKRALAKRKPKVEWVECTFDDDDRVVEIDVYFDDEEVGLLSKSDPEINEWEWFSEGSDADKYTTHIEEYAIVVDMNLNGERLTVLKSTIRQALQSYGTLKDTWAEKHRYPKNHPKKRTFELVAASGDRQALRVHGKIVGHLVPTVNDSGQTGMEADHNLVQYAKGSTREQSMVRDMLYEIGAITRTKATGTGRLLLWVALIVGALVALISLIA